jgi:hypothetical protein
VIFGFQFFFNQSVMGAAERYITPDTGYDGMVSLLKSLILRRNQLLFEQHQWVGIRVSILPTADQLMGETRTLRQSFVLLPGIVQVPPGRTRINVPAIGTIPGVNFVGATPDQFRAVLQQRTTFSDNRHSITYMSMIPDAVSFTEPQPLHLKGNPAWEAAYDALRKFLVEEDFQVKALTSLTVDPIANATGLVREAAVPNRLGVRVATAGAPAIAVGNRVAVQKFKRFLGNKPSLNGTFFVESIDTTTQPGSTIFYLRGTEGLDPTMWKVLGTIRRKRYTYFGLNRLDPYRVGIHKRGRPSLAPRGRRQTRVTYDP